MWLLTLSRVFPVAMLQSETGRLQKSIQLIRAAHQYVRRRRGQLFAKAPRRLRPVELMLSYQTSAQKAPGQSRPHRLHTAPES